MSRKLTARTTDGVVPGKESAGDGRYLSTSVQDALGCGLSSTRR